MKLLATLAAALWLATTPLSAAERLQAFAVDEAAANPEFAAFRDDLLAAVVARDIDAILSSADADIDLSFGGQFGHAGLRANLTVDPDTLSDEYRHLAPEMREDYWAALESVLRMGGRFEDDGMAFIAPYTFVQEIPEDYDAFETYFVIDSGVPLRDRPIRFGTEIFVLDHDIVRAIEGGEGTNYLHVRLADGTTGFVRKDALRSVIDYRAIFRRGKGGWRMTTFIAGD